MRGCQGHHWASHWCAPAGMASCTHFGPPINRAHCLVVVPGPPLGLPLTRTVEADSTASNCRATDATWRPVRLHEVEVHQLMAPTAVEHRSSVPSGWQTAQARTLQQTAQRHDRVQASI